MKRRLGEILVDSGLITAEDLQLALELQKKRKLPLGKLLTEMNLATENQISESLSQQIGYPYVNLSSYPIKPEIATIIPTKLIQRYAMVPFDMKNNCLLVAASEPSNLEAIDAIRRITQKDLEIYFATDDDIQFVINRFHGQKRLAEQANNLIRTNPSVEVAATEEVLSVVEDVPVVKFMNTLLSNAFRDRASDIHIEPGETAMRIRFRIDGTMYAIMESVSLSFHSPIVSRIKVMANLDIAEKRIPQDGRVPIEVDGKKADLRVSVIPSNFGEKVVLRILYKQNELLALDGLGLDETERGTIEEILSYPYGLVYVCGPTGSGKTTTIYSFLHRINSIHKNIITLEDPIEYILPGITQINVNPKVGLTFANGLRSFLRQDPDIILVGETRDEETAQITVQAALTGHLVLSTIHTNDAVGVISRLINMNIEPYLISSSLVGIVAQRLVRRICPKCKAEQKLTEGFLKLNRLPQDIHYFYGRGCEFCKNTGYLGRIGIFEIIKINDALREAIVAHAPQSKIRELSIENGMHLLSESGLKLVRNGATTIDEVLRVTAFK